MQSLSFKPAIEPDKDRSADVRIGLQNMPREYFDWLSNSRNEIIRLISANNSLGTRALAVEPLKNLPPDVLASARRMINEGRIAEAVDRLIEETFGAAKNEVIADLQGSVIARLTTAELA